MFFVSHLYAYSLLVHSLRMISVSVMIPPNFELASGKHPAQTLAAKNAQCAARRAW
jgi:hypothetical protein